MHRLLRISDGAGPGELLGENREYAQAVGAGIDHEIMKCFRPAISGSADWLVHGRIVVSDYHLCRMPITAEICVFVVDGESE